MLDGKWRSQSKYPLKIMTVFTVLNFLAFEGDTKGALSLKCFSNVFGVDFILI